MLIRSKAISLYPCLPSSHGGIACCVAARTTGVILINVICLPQYYLNTKSPVESAEGNAFPVNLTLDEVLYCVSVWEAEG